MKYFFDNFKTICQIHSAIIPERMVLSRSDSGLTIADNRSSVFSLQVLVTLIFIFFLFIPSSFSQSRNAVARVGKTYISPEEFTYRFELSPHIFPEDETDIDSMKLDFLYSIIAEKLWADEAEKLGYADNKRFTFFFSPLKDMYVRDALFKKEILSKVDISPEDIVNGIKDISSTLDISIITSGEKSTIDSVYQLLASGADPDSLDNEIKNIYVNRQRINFGDLKDEELENKLYSLLPGMITTPLLFDNSYAVFYLNGKENNEKVEDLKDVSEEVKKIIRNRRTERQYNIYLSRLLSGRTIIPDDDLFYKFADEVLKALNEQKAALENEGESPEKFYLDETALYKVKDRLSSAALNKTFFEIDNKTFSLSDFLAFFTLNDFVVNKLDKQNVYSNLSHALKKFIQLSVITLEGYHQNLQDSPEVKAQLSMWRSNYLAQLYKNQFLDSVSVSDEDVYDYYLESLKDSVGIKQVKVLEFKTDSLGYFEKIFTGMESGRNFRDIINELNSAGIDAEIKETGFFPVTANEIGRIADKMNVGEVYGPLKRFNKYEVFQLIEVKNTADSLIKNFDSVKDGIRQELIFKKMAARLTDNTKALLTKYHVETNPRILNNINTGSMNMFVHRYMGFGGRIAAVPYTSPIIQYRKLREILQKYLP